MCGLYRARAGRGGVVGRRWCGLVGRRAAGNNRRMAGNRFRPDLCEGAAGANRPESLVEFGRCTVELGG